jgi:hypothetical protein
MPRGYTERYDRNRTGMTARDNAVCAWCARRPRSRARRGSSPTQITGGRMGTTLLSRVGEVGLWVAGAERAKCFPFEWVALSNPFSSSLCDVSHGSVKRG